MRCLDPNVQLFALDDGTIIGIDWGKNGDKAVQVKGKLKKDGTFEIVEMKELRKDGI